MKFMVLSLFTLFSACTVQDAGTIWFAPLTGADSADAKLVNVLGRVWTVSPVRDQDSVYVAQRDNLDLNPFGAPPHRRTPQAVRAIELATGCRVVQSTMVQDTSARFYASAVCR